MIFHAPTFEVLHQVDAALDRLLDRGSDRVPEALEATIVLPIEAEWRADVVPSLVELAAERAAVARPFVAHHPWTALELQGARTQAAGQHTPAVIGMILQA